MNNVIDKGYEVNDQGANLSVRGMTEHCVTLCLNVVTLNEAAEHASSEEKESILRFIAEESLQKLLITLNKLNKIAISSVNQNTFTSLKDEAITHHESIDELAIGSRIRELRKGRALTLKDIAAAVGVTPQSVHSWERKGKIPSSNKLIPLANALGCDPTWLLGKQNPGIPHHPEHADFAQQ